MTSEDIILQQYNMYSEQKEKFVDRSFTTNKFYLVLILAIVLAMGMTRDIVFAYGITTTFIFSAAGMAICTLWWINVDSYNFLIKIKLAKVLQELECQLPVKPYTMEFTGITDYKKNRKEFVFADIQKALAIVVLLLFLVLFLKEIVSIIL